MGRGKVPDSVWLPLIVSWNFILSVRLIFFFFFLSSEHIFLSFSDFKIQGLAKGWLFRHACLCCLGKEIFCSVLFLLLFVFHHVLFFLRCTALLAEIKVFRVPDLPLTQYQCCCGHSAPQHRIRFKIMQ